MQRTHAAGRAMAGEQPAYRAYLLRLWQVRSGGHLVWRASIEDAHTGMRLGFASLEQLIDFLQQAIGRTDQPGQDVGSNAE